MTYVAPGRQALDVWDTRLFNTFHSHRLARISMERKLQIFRRALWASDPEAQRERRARVRAALTVPPVSDEALRRLNGDASEPQWDDDEADE